MHKYISFQSIRLKCEILLLNSSHYWIYKRFLLPQRLESSQNSSKIKIIFLYFRILTLAVFSPLQFSLRTLNTPSKTLFPKIYLWVSPHFLLKNFPFLIIKLYSIIFLCYCISSLRIIWRTILKSHFFSFKKKHDIFSHSF